MRGAADAVMVGAGTVLADDPSLTVRDPAYRGDPVLRVVVDARGRVPPERRVFSAEAPTLVATTHAASRERVDAWARTGAEVLLYDAEEGCVPLRDLVGDLGKRDVQLLLLEGGPTLAWGAVREGIVDKIVLFLAPLLVGGAAAPGVLGGDGFAPVGRALHLRITATEAVGPDLKVEAYVHRDR